MADNKNNNKPSDGSTPAGQTNLQQSRNAMQGVIPNNPGQPSLQTRYGQLGFSDPSNVYANQKELFITISYPGVNQQAQFKAFITDYSDTFTANWNKEELLQRNDIIATYKNTTRSLTLGWGVPCASIEESQRNLQETGMLMKMLYGTYTSLDTGAPQSLVLNQPPLLRVRFSNLVQQAQGEGLWIVVSSFTFSPDLDAGFFDPGSQLFPKSWNLSLEGDIIHEGDLGWANGKWRGQDTFPFMPKGVNPSTAIPTEDPAPLFRSQADAIKLQQEIDEALRLADEALAMSREANAAAEQSLNLPEEQDSRKNSILGSGN